MGIKLKLLYGCYILEKELSLMINLVLESQLEWIGFEQDLKI